ncbi:AraC family transcriptional regulator [Ketobacter alkanivorans]|uniref:HTH araC/xylS-type domain-containing protein n=1 Tax=Ketobacter alkanivorans TaxID=1917421 RepID=A0A2K9LMD8_9GAMM|nr:AraC family transcriptional regulator [Ketobacter alkanivorans]AUM13433.1 hypothetical protein Kalk_13825 [Ketobacter alkanivorans]
MESAVTGTVRVGYVRALLDYLEDHDLATASVFSPELQQRLDDDCLSERIPVPLWSDLLAKAIAVTDDEHLPLKLAQSIIPKHWGVFAYAAMTCKNLAEVAAILIRYERLIDDANDAKLLADGDQIALQWIPRIPDLHPALMQISVASWVVFAQRHTGRSDLIADVEFSCPPPRDITQYQHLFGGRVRFDQPITQLRFPKDYLQLPITYHDPESHQLLVSQVIQQIQDLKRPDEYQQTVRGIIVQQLSHGRCTLDSVANGLNTPTRSLQHQLEQSGTSFRQLLDNTRAELARHYLDDPDMALVDVAFLLGFSEQSPFTKAFKRWTGETPGEYRKRHTG